MSGSKGFKTHGFDDLAAYLNDAAGLVEANTDIIEAGGDVIAEAAKTNVRAKLNKKPSGQLEGDIHTRVVKPRQAEIGVQRDQPSAVYAAVHEFGHPGITPKRARALRFEVDGQVVYAQKVVIPQRAFLRPAADENGKDAAQAMGEKIDGELKGMVKV